MLFIARANGAAIRRNTTRAATTYPILEGGNHMIGPVRGSTRVCVFRRHHLLLRKVSINKVVLV